MRRDQWSLQNCKFWNREFRWLPEGLVCQTGLETSTGTFRGLPRWLSGKESACQCSRPRRLRFDPWIRKIPWRRKWQPTTVFLPGKSHGQRILVATVHGVTESWSQLSNWACTLSYLTRVSRSLAQPVQVAPSRCSVSHHCSPLVPHTLEVAQLQLIRDGHCWVGNVGTMPEHLFYSVRREGGPGEPGAHLSLVPHDSRRGSGPLRVLQFPGFLVTLWAGASFPVSLLLHISVLTPPVLAFLWLWSVESSDLSRVLASIHSQSFLRHMSLNWNVYMYWSISQ